MKSTKILALLLVLAMCFGMLASCNLFKKPDGTDDPIDGGNSGDVIPDQPTPDEPVKQPELGGEFIAPVRGADAELPEAKLGSYTYNSWSTALGSNWNPHTWESNAEQSMLGYITSPFVTIEAMDTVNGIYQWVGEMATAIRDVTQFQLDLLANYNINLPAGVEKVEDIEKGFVFEFELNPNAKWEDGTPINADSYIYSMKQLLDPTMKNYRANLYIDGESAIAGGKEYYYSLDEGFYVAVGTKYDTNQAAIDAGETVYVDLWNLWGAKGYLSADGAEAPQWAAITDETVYTSADGSDAISGAALWGGYSSILEVGGSYASYVSLYTVNDNMGATYDGVGLIKTGDYSFLYICKSAIDFNYFLTSCTDTWLVHQGLYEANMVEENGMKYTTYGTSVDTTMSYGAYKMTVFQDGKQVIYEQNENWYGYEKTADGYLLSYTQFEVDGKYLQQYMTTKIIIDVMDEATAKQKFLKGEVDSYSPTAAELEEYKLSDRLQVVDETYTMSFFFHTDVENLQKLDASNKNANSVVLSNTTFRQAMSLAIDRADFVTATQAWTPAFSLMNHLYHYDIYNDPYSSYRKSEEAMQAIVNLYGVEYGEGKLYETLEEAHDSITGYNLTEAKALFAKAYAELTTPDKDGNVLYNGGNIKIQIGWAKGALTEDDEKQCQLVEKYLNAALEGTGFGTVDLEPLGNIQDRYDDTAAGLYAIGYGAWGGAAFYPFRNMQVYTDPDQYDINEAGCWDPKTDTLTLTVEGKEVTMTWQKWGNSMISGGPYADADNKVKLSITAQMEEAFLKFYYRIPLAVTTVCSLSSYKADDYTDQYNIMYGFGGFRIMNYNYNDAEWAAYVAEQGGELSYK